MKEKTLINHEAILKNNEVILAQIDSGKDDRSSDSLFATKTENAVVGSSAEPETIFTILFRTSDDKKYNVLVTSDENAARERFLMFSNIFFEKGRDGVLAELRKE